MNSISKKKVKKLYKQIGLNVQQKRLSKGLSQLELATAIGHKSTTIISQAEIGEKKHFNIEQLYKISIALECDIKDFFN
ncbi:MAG: helix-turn-helix transcriptional regulator [Epsilonproteobacteria bacterium]|nr:helix-turn-helix transcriptional regulator [Campylobacterota bacterium]